MLINNVKVINMSQDNEIIKAHLKTCNFVFPALFDCNLNTSVDSLCGKTISVEGFFLCDNFIVKNFSQIKGKISAENKAEVKSQFILETIQSLVSKNDNVSGIINITQIISCSLIDCLLTSRAYDIRTTSSCAERENVINAVCDFMKLTMTSLKFSAYNDEEKNMMVCAACLSGYVGFFKLSFHPVFWQLNPTALMFDEIKRWGTNKKIDTAYVNSLCGIIDFMANHEAKEIINAIKNRTI